MNTNDADFLIKLLAMFKIEAKEHLDVISSGLQLMEKSGDNIAVEQLEIIYREAHSLKGAARSVNLTEIVTLCQTLESVFSALKRGGIRFSAFNKDALQQLVDYCYSLIDNPEISTEERRAIRKISLALEETLKEKETKDHPPATVHTVQKAPHDTPHPENHTAASKPPPAEEVIDPEPALPSPGIDAAPAPPPLEVPGPVAAETIRITTKKLDTLLLQAEEMIGIKLAAGQRATELREMKKTFDLWRKGQRKSEQNAKKLQGQTAENNSSASFFASFESSLATMVRAAEYDYRTSATMIDKLLDDMKKTLMLPFSSLLEVLPRFVRELYRSAGKKINLTTQGGNIEIDRRVLEEMKDPLIHLIRNCVDHGIEPPREREQKGKPPVGSMEISVSSKDNKIEIIVADDGAGIQTARLRASAIKQNVLSKEAAAKLTDEAAMQLVFQSGITTSPLITDISGRGLGLAIVREKVEKLNGTITIDSRRDKGTTFRMVVPLTLATFRGTLIRVGGQIFVLPSTNVQRVTRTLRESIQTVENRETLIFDGHPLSLVHLACVLGMDTPADRQGADDGPVQVVILGLAEKRIAFMVDEILHEQEVLVKPLGRQLARVRNISGATVLGNGKVAPILNVADLLKSAVTATGPKTMERSVPPEENRNILVVEDSITARTLLKNILESAGYNVHTAVDGLDGITSLRSRDFDLIVSDVEMPRMNGFELTAKIRADQKLSELPVVLVTALESREDRERGIDVGANAYIVKSSFDQSNLLEVIGRLT